MKRIALLVGIAASFLIGFAGVVKAWPGVPDRSAFYGYFQNQYDNSGDSVIGGGYPGSVTNANAFISFLEGQLYGGSAQNRTGAAFTIQTMRGNVSGWSRNRPPTAFEIADWESRVRYADSHGLVTWSTNFTFTGNSLWQGNGSGANYNDDAFYYETDTRVAMVFRTTGGALAYAIKRDCGNPLTNGYMPGLDNPWSSTAWTTVQAKAKPGDTVTFSHYVENYGPTTTQMWWSTYEGASSAGTGLGVTSGGPDIYTAGQVRNVRNENFRIPSNAANNQKYCRYIMWDPINSGGGRYGSGAEACVVVYIPAKLHASMSVNPSSVVSGGTTSFTPGISSEQNGSPITVNCSISRTITPPGGGTSSLGNQPCVDQSGNPNILVNNGASVTLRANTYKPPDSVVVGSKVCDTITITNPSTPDYFRNPSDQFATACVIVAKTPYVYFMGNDVWAGGGFAAVNPACNINAKIATTGRTLDSGAPAGSVGEYNVFALGQITSFGSSGHPLTGTGTIGALGRQLTFANNEPGNTKLGYYGASGRCINDYTAMYGSSPLIGAGTIDVGGQGSGSWRINGDLTLHGTMPTGGEQVYYASGNITIDNDLKYPANYNNLGSIPSLLVISTGNIYVAPGVKQMDGTFVASGNGTTKGVFYTCWPKNEPASTSNPCNANQLVVNGAVLAGKVDLFRSFGATGSNDAARQQPGEIFNFSTEEYLNNVINVTSQPTVQTMNVLDLPPRY